MQWLLLEVTSSNINSYFKIIKGVIHTVLMRWMADNVNNQLLTAFRLRANNLGMIIQYTWRKRKPVHRNRYHGSDHDQHGPKYLIRITEATCNSSSNHRLRICAAPKKNFEKGQFWFNVQSRIYTAWKTNSLDKWSNIIIFGAHSIAQRYLLIMFEILMTHCESVNLYSTI